MAGITPFNSTIPRVPSASYAGHANLPNRVSNVSVPAFWTGSARKGSALKAGPNYLKNRASPASKVETAKEKRIQTIHEQQAAANFEKELAAFLNSAAENWNEKVKQQIITMIQERLGVSKTRHERTQIENQLQKFLPKRFRELLQALDGDKKRALAQVQTYVPVVSPIDFMVPPTGNSSWQYATLCVSNNSGLWMAANSSNVQAVQLFSLLNGVIQRNSNASATIQAQLPQQQGKNNNCFMACNNGEFQILTSTGITTVFHKVISNQKLVVPEYEVSPTISLADSYGNPIWRIIKLIQDGVAAFVFEPNGQNLVLSQTNSSGRFNTSSNIHIPNSNATADEAMFSFLDNTTRVLVDTPTGLYEVQFDSTGKVGPVTEINGGFRLGACLATPKTLLTPGMPISILALKDTGIKHLLYTYYPGIYPNVGKIVLEQILGTVLNSFPFPTIADCGAGIYFGVRAASYGTSGNVTLAYDFYDAQQNSSSIIGGPGSITNSTGPSDTGCEVDETTIRGFVCYLDLNQDAPCLTITLNPTEATPSPLVATASPVGATPSPLAATSSPPGAVPSPVGVVPSPVGAVPSPLAATPCPIGAVPSPVGALPSPLGVVPSPIGTVPSPVGALPSPLGAVPSPVGALPSPLGAIPSPVGVVPSPIGAVPSPLATTPCPVGAVPSPVNAAEPVVITVALPIDLNTTYIPITGNIVSFTNNTATIQLVDEQGVKIVFTANLSAVPLFINFTASEVYNFSIGRTNDSNVSEPILVFDGCTFDQDQACNRSEVKPYIPSPIAMPAEEVPPLNLPLIISLPVAGGILAISAAIAAILYHSCYKKGAAERREKRLAAERMVARARERTIARGQTNV